MINQLRKLGAVLIVALLTAAGCGGGGGGDGAPPPLPTGGIVRTGVAVGPITDFGSVWVNGVRYQTNTETSFIRDDNPSSQAEFEVGETVIVTGTIEDDNTTAVAETVELDELVKGPATAASASTATVMGQTVRSSAGTFVDNNCTGVTYKDLSGLTGFFAVEVYGTVETDGSINATRIECKLAGELTEFEVNGIVKGLTAETFMINGLEVNYSGTLLIQDFPNSQISNGDPVEVKGAPDNFVSSGDPDVLAASKVQYKGNRLDGAEGDHYEIEGFILEFRSISDFDVLAGTLVFTVETQDGVTNFEGDRNLLDVNVKVEVEGDLNSDLNIFATKVEIKTSTNIRVAGLVDEFNVGEPGVIRILDIVVNTADGTTQFEDKRDDDPNFDASTVMAGDYVEARGQEMPPGQITAFEFRRDDIDPDTELRGFIEPESVTDRNSFSVLGVLVDTSGELLGPVQYQDEMDAIIGLEAFWTFVETELDAGRSVLVDIKGREEADGKTLTATEVGLEME